MWLPTAFGGLVVNELMPLQSESCGVVSQGIQWHPWGNFKKGTVPICPSGYVPLRFLVNALKERKNFTLHAVVCSCVTVRGRFTWHWLSRTTFWHRLINLNSTGVFCLYSTALTWTSGVDQYCRPECCNWAKALIGCCLQTELVCTHIPISESHIRWGHRASASGLGSHKNVWVCSSDVTCYLTCVPAASLQPT